MTFPFVRKGSSFTAAEKIHRNDSFLPLSVVCKEVIMKIGAGVCLYMYIRIYLHQ